MIITPLKAAGLALLFACANVSAAGRIVSLPEGPPGLKTSMPQLSMDIWSRVTALNAQPTSLAAAQALKTSLAFPDMNPSQHAANKLVLEAIKTPQALAAVQALLKDTPQAGAGRELGLLVQRIDPQHFAGLESPALDWSAANVGELRANLDSFFINAGPAKEIPDAVVAGSPSKNVPAAWRLKRQLATPYTVTVGKTALAEQVSLGELMKALETEDRTFLGRFRRQDAAQPKNNLIRLDENTGKVRVTAVYGEGQERTVWADFLNSEKHPLLDKLKEKFTFAPFRATGGDEHPVTYEEPNIDDDTAQLTIYGLKVSATNGAISKEDLHVYVGKELLVTTHKEQRSGIDKTLHLLSETGRFKTSSDLMVFILADTIGRYGAAMETLSADFSRMSDKVTSKRVDDSVNRDAAAAGHKIDEIFKTVTAQKRVLRDLLSINEFHQSEFVPVAALEAQIEMLDHHLETLGHYQDTKNGLIDLYRAQKSNGLDAAMKRWAAVTGLIGVASVIVGLFGVNYELPFKDNPHMFLVIVAGMLSLLIGLFAFLRRKDWL